MAWKDDHDLRSYSQTKWPHSFISIYLACLPESIFWLSNHIYLDLSFVEPRHCQLVPGF